MADAFNWRYTMQLCRQHGGRSDCVLSRHHRGDCWNQAEWDRHTPQERVAHCDGRPDPDAEPTTCPTCGSDDPWKLAGTCARDWVVDGVYPGQFHDGGPR